MATEAGICNSALSKLGNNRINSLTEGTTAANLCLEQYGKLRDHLLRSHDWNFAASRVKLAQFSSTPAFGYNFQYALPSDWMRTISVHPGDRRKGHVTDYATESTEAEGRVLRTDCPDVHLRYVRKVGDPNVMDPAFREALAWRLAMELAVPLAKSGSLRDRMAAGFDDALAIAKSIDGQDDPPQVLPDGSWVMARH
jgi:hypothetical protein